jgi:hypothetical protein
MTPRTSGADLKKAPEISEDWFLRNCRVRQSLFLIVNLYPGTAVAQQRGGRSGQFCASGMESWLHCGSPSGI